MSTGEGLGVKPGQDPTWELTSPDLTRDAAGAFSLLHVQERGWWWRSRRALGSGMRLCVLSESSGPQAPLAIPGAGAGCGPGGLAFRMGT